MTINEKDYEIIRKFEDILRRGYYASGEQVTELHNRVLGTSLRSTNCSACIAARVRALVDAANKYDRQRAAEKASDNGGGEASEPRTEGGLDSTKAEENKAPGGDTSMKERMARVRAAKKKK